MSAIGRRALLKLAALAVARRVASARPARRPSLPQKVVLVTIGGIRRQESYSPDGLENIPHIVGDLLPRSLFYTHVWNEGVTSHFNTVSSILTGVWQHVDDWGRDPPAHPTIFRYVQDQLGVSPAETWVVTSNKAMTSNIGVGANVAGRYQQQGHDQQHWRRRQRDPFETTAGGSGGAHRHGLQQAQEPGPRPAAGRIDRPRS